MALGELLDYDGWNGWEQWLTPRHRRPDGKTATAAVERAFSILGRLFNFAASRRS